MRPELHRYFAAKKARAGVAGGAGDGAITEGDGDKPQVYVIASSSPLIASKV